LLLLISYQRSTWEASAKLPSLGKYSFVT